MNARRRSTRRARVFPVAVALAGAALLGGAWALRYHAWLGALGQHAELSRLDKPADACPPRDGCGPVAVADANRLGWLSESRSPRAFFRVPERKPDGVYRIGFFGCSFVSGDEVAAGEDFPAQLQGLLRPRGGRRVEALNFGVSAYGMGQSYLLWSLLARRYGLDEAVFLPMSFHRVRDTSFVFNPTAYGPVHARYVLRDGVPELVEPLGATPAERSRLYYRWWTPWRYARYDQRPPAPLRSLLPAGRQWRGNPFYYWRSDDDEAEATYAALFEQAAAATRLVVVSDGSRLTDRLRRRLGGRGLFVTSALNELTSRGPGLYSAPLGHMSALGNWARAHELAALLSGRGEADFEAPTLAAPEPAPWSGAGALSEDGGVVVRAGALPAGVLLYYDDTAAGPVEPAPDFRSDGIAALVASDFQGRPLVGTRRPLRPEEPLSVTFKVDGRPVSVPVGRLRSSSGVVGRVEISTVSFFGVEAGGTPWRLTMDQRDFVRGAEIWAGARLSDLRLGNGARTLLSGTVQPGGVISWRPAEAPHFIYLRADEDSWRGPERYRAARSLDLVLARDGAAPRRVPLYGLAWRRVRLPLSASQPQAGL